MFKNTFTFEGRIRRTEYGISLLIFAIGRVIISFFIVIGMADSSGRAPEFANAFITLLSIPLFIFFLAQGSKRAHDVGISGWWQIVPLVPLYLLFKEGDFGSNRFGEDPKAHENNF
jgi:uncharacterized membrane protein YhaH (DUF805 family)